LSAPRASHPNSTATIASQALSSDARGDRSIRWTRGDATRARPCGAGVRLGERITPAGASLTRTSSAPDGGTVTTLTEVKAAAGRWIGTGVHVERAGTRSTAPSAASQTAYRAPAGARRSP